MFILLHIVSNIIIMIIINISQFVLAAMLPFAVLCLSSLFESAYPVYCTHADSCDQFLRSPITQYHPWLLHVGIAVRIRGYTAATPTGATVWCSSCRVPSMYPHSYSNLQLEPPQYYVKWDLRSRTEESGCVIFYTTLYESIGLNLHSYGHNVH